MKTIALFCEKPNYSRISIFGTLLLGAKDKPIDSLSVCNWVLC